MKGNSLFLLLFFILGCFVPQSAKADYSLGFIYNGIHYFTDFETHTAIVAYHAIDTNYSGPIDIPATIIDEGSLEKTEYTVVEIGYQAFQNCQHITSVTIPPTVKHIGIYAFADCYSMESVNLGGVEVIDESAFHSCRSLKSIVIPSSVTSIGNAVFSGCESLESIELGDNVVELGIGVFVDCKSLRSARLPEGLTAIDGLFVNCESLTSVEIPHHVKSIGTNSFNDCKSLQHLEFPDGVESIGMNACQGCSSLETIKMPRNLQKIGNYAFADCSSLLSIDIPEGVTRIASNTFQNCTSLREVKIGENVEYIGIEAFLNCSSLKELDLTSKVSAIDVKAFQNCTSLSKVSTGKYLNILSNDAFAYCQVKELYVNSNFADNHRWTEIGNYYLEKVVVGDDVTEIKEFALAGCDNLKTIELPESITTIGRKAFLRCCIEDFTIPENVKTIDSQVFDGCNSLTIIKSNAAIPPTIMNDTFPEHLYTTATLYVPTEEAVELYKEAKGWKNFWNICPESLMGINEIRQNHTDTIYNINGLRVSDNYGIKIRDRKKFFLHF